MSYTIRLMTFTICLFLTFHSKAQEQVTTLAQGLLHPWSIAINGGIVYWVEDDETNGAVKKVSTNGGIITTLASGLATPNAIAVDDSSVYWIEWNHGSNGSLKKISKEGGSVFVLVSDLNNAQHFLAQDNDYLYWSDTQINGGGMIRKISKNGGATITLVNSGIYNLTPAITVDDGLVYFYDGGNNIFTVPTAGGNVSNISQGSPVAFFVYGQDIYWTEFTNSLIKKMPKTGGAVNVLSASAYHPINLVVDGNYVYWIEFESPGRVLKVPVNGGAETVISNQANTMGIVIDSTSIYWAENVNYNQGKIQKFDLATGLELHETVSSDNLSIIPDPANNSFSLLFTAPNISSFHLSIYSILGELIYSETLENIASGYSKEMNLENLKRGLYFIQIIANNRTYTKKVVFTK